MAALCPLYVYTNYRFPSVDQSFKVESNDPLKIKCPYLGKYFATVTPLVCPLNV